MRSHKNPAAPKTKVKPVKEEGEKFVKHADTSPKVYQRDKIKIDLRVRELEWTPKQKEFFALVRDNKTRVVFVNGPAGSSKTILAVRAALELLNARKVSDIVCIRAAVESADSKLGYLPGDLQSKYDVYMAPFADKLEELLPADQIKALVNDGRITNQPINFCRGLSFTARVIIMDEMQCATFSELTTLISRLGKFSKMIICADPDQSDLPYGKRGGFEKMMKIFGDEESREMGIHCFQFEQEDIMRSDLCKYIVIKLSEQKKIDIAREDELHARKAAEHKAQNGHGHGDHTIITDRTAIVRVSEHAETWSPTPPE